MRSMTHTVRVTVRCARGSVSTCPLGSAPPEFATGDGGRPTTRRRARWSSQPRCAGRRRSRSTCAEAGRSSGRLARHASSTASRSDGTGAPQPRGGRIGDRMQMMGAHFDDRFSAEDVRAGQQPVPDGAERIEVRPRVHVSGAFMVSGAM